MQHITQGDTLNLPYQVFIDGAPQDVTDWPVIELVIGNSARTYRYQFERVDNATGLLMVSVDTSVLQPGINHYSIYTELDSGDTRTTDAQPIQIVRRIGV